MVSSSKRVIIRLSLLIFFLFITLNIGMIYAQTDVVSGNIGTYSFPAGSYEVVSRADDIFSPLEIISQGEAPSSTYTYVADGNGYLSVDFQPTAGTGWLVLELNGEAYGYGTAVASVRMFKAGKLSHSRYLLQHTRLTMKWFRMSNQEKLRSLTPTHGTTPRV